MLAEPLAWEQPEANPEEDAKALADVMALQSWAGGMPTGRRR